MTEVARPSMEARLAAVERQLAELLRRNQQGPARDWRRVVGMFSDDEFSRRVDAAGREIREQDRRETAG